MTLIPFPADPLEVGAALPFDLLDPEGTVVLARGTVVADPAQRAALAARTLVVDEADSAAWRLAREQERDLADAFDDAFQARPAPAPPPVAAPAAAPDLIAELGLVQQHLQALLMETAPDDTWWPRLLAVAARLDDLRAQHADAVLFLVLQRAVRRHEHYSSRHALLCALTSALCGRQLGFPDADVRSLVLAALTMNWSMTAMQDELTLRERTPSLDQRIRIERHPALSAAQLQAAGATDALCTAVVERHHLDGASDLPLAELASPERLARVLRRLDVFFAKISPRLSRPGMPATLAARAACLGANGAPDEVGSAILRVLGIYPPGTCVALANGELAMVLRRGEHVSQPQVVSLTGPGGTPLKLPQARDTASAPFRIVGTARPSDLRTSVHLGQLLALL